MKKCNVAVNAEILKQSVKAVFLQIEDAKMWFPKSKVEFAEDGSVCAVSKKMLETKKIEAVEYEEVKAENAEWQRNGWVVEPKNQITRESEKAVQIAFTAFRGGMEIETKIWFPKSQTRVEDGNIFVKAWIFLKNAVEASNRADMALEIWSRDENGGLVCG